MADLNFLKQRTEAEQFRLHLWLFMIMLGAVFLYKSILQFDFISIDDGLFVYLNPHIADGFTRAALSWAFSADLFHQSQNLDYWQPLTVLSRLLDVQFWGMDAGAHHRTNLILHCFNIFLLGRLLIRFGLSVVEVFIITAIFAWHPVQVETVAWVSARKDLLSALFGLSSMHLYLFYTRSRTLKHYLLTFILFLCAILSKPMMATLPLIYLLFDALASKDVQPLCRLKRFAEKIPFLIFSFLIMAVVMQSLGREVIRGGRWNLPHASAILFTQISKIFYPVNLMLYHSEHPVEFNALIAVLGIGLFFIVLICGFAAFKRAPWILLGWFWFVLMLLPTLSRRYPEDRFLYLPLVGILLCVFAGFGRWIRNEFIRNKLLPVIAVIFLCFFYRVSQNQIRYWENDVTLYQRILSIQPDNQRVKHMLGRAYAYRGDIEKASGMIGKAFLTYSHAEAEARAYFYHGIELERVGQLSRAAQAYKKASDLKPHDFQIEAKRRQLEQILAQQSL